MGSVDAEQTFVVDCGSLSSRCTYPTFACSACQQSVSSCRVGFVVGVVVGRGLVVQERSLSLRDVD